MLCTTIIPTVGRDTLQQTVQSALAQNLPLDMHEIVVVNNSGAPLPPAEWQSNPQVRTVNINRVPVCMSHNMGAAAARGEWIKFLHDDDYLLPGGLSALLAVAKRTQADWVYGGVQIIDWDEKPVDRWLPEVRGNILYIFADGEHGIHLSQSVIRRSAFMAIAGCNHADPIVDHDLLCRISLRSDVDCANAVVAAVRVDRSRSTGVWEIFGKSSRTLRELVLNSEQAFARISAGPRQSELVNTGVGTIHYAYGKASRPYAKSMVVNLRRGELSTALRRGAALARLALPHILQPYFKDGLLNRLPNALRIESTQRRQQVSVNDITE